MVRVLPVNVALLHSCKAEKLSLPKSTAPSTCGVAECLYDQTPVSIEEDVCKIATTAKGLSLNCICTG
jgi:hypothetical protein